MKPACETASFHRSCRPVATTLYLLRSPVETAENSCNSNCWIQPTKKLNQNKFYWRRSTKGTEQCNFVKRLSILIAKETWEIVPLHREIGRLQLSFSLQQLCCSIMKRYFLKVAEVFSLLKVKLNLKICARREPLLIIFLKADCSNKNCEKKLKKYM